MGELDVVIREADECDIDAVVELWVELSEYHWELDARYWELATDAREMMRQWWGDAAEAEDRLLLVAEVRGEVVGFIHGKLANTAPPFVDRWFVNVSDVSVKESYRGLGIGRQLLEAIVEGFADSEAEEIRLTCAVMNELAQGFYRKLEFEVITYGLYKALK